MPGLLRGERLDALRDALQAMTTSRAAEAAWDAIRAPDKPALDVSIQWALEQTGHYARTHGHRAGPTATDRQDPGIAH